MPVRNIVMYALAAALVVGGLLWFTGIVKFDAKTGQVKVDPKAANLKDAPMDPYLKADLLMAAFKYSDAATAYSNAMQADPGNKSAPHARYLRASCLENAGDAQRAAAEYSAFIAAYPRHEDVEKARRGLARVAPKSAR